MQIRGYFMDTALKLDDELKNKVQHIASIRHCDPDTIMIEAIEDYVKRSESRESAIHLAHQAWDNFQQDGLHLTENEVNNWLDTWGTEEESKLPPCHK
jgi:predicted transcriptional regulator